MPIIFILFYRKGLTVKTIKTSRRDLAYVLSKNLIGGTTVAGTLIIANLVGINIFATGGIGMWYKYSCFCFLFIHTFF